LPGSPAGEYVDLAGDPASADQDRTPIPLLTGGSEVGIILLSVASARRVRRAREMAVLGRTAVCWQYSPTSATPSSYKPEHRRVTKCHPTKPEMTAPGRAPSSQGP